jgi:uncharacterized damage-inducible protein DinB
MVAKSEELAARFDEASKAFAGKVTALSDRAWQAKTPEEGWTVAATAHHAAGSSGAIAMMVQACATGSAMPPITMDGLNQLNADHAKQFANASREDTLALLTQTTAPAAAAVRGLSDEQLARRATMPFGMEMSTEQIIENVLIGHLAGHGASIDAAANAVV